MQAYEALLIQTTPLLPQEFLSLWRNDPIYDPNIQNAHIGKILLP